MPSLDFFAAKDDMVRLLEFIFSSTDLRIFESYSLPGKEIREFISVESISEAFGLGFDLNGNGSSILLQMVSKSACGDPKFRRIALIPEKCDGHTFRYCVEGGGIFKLYLGGIHKDIITKSHFGHNSQVRAEKFGVANGIDWKLLSKISNKVMYCIRNHLSAAKAKSRPVMIQAFDLVKSGIILKESYQCPWAYEFPQIVNKRQVRPTGSKS